MPRNRDSKFEEAYVLYLNGYSLNQVSDALGVTRQCVFKAFKIRKLKLRGKNFKSILFYDDKKFTIGVNGYYRLTNDDRTYLHRYKWEKEVGVIPEGYDIHHLDEDKSNNELSNLECIDKGDHARKHGFRNNQFTKKK